MLLSDLVTDPRLGLVLRSGEEHLGRTVRGVYITDLIDPRRYLAGGELVLSGLVWHNEPADSERFVAALADSGVAGLAAGTARLGRAPDDLVEACRAHGLPLLEVPLSVSFSTLAERVIREQHRALAPTRELVSAIASGADLEQVLVLAAAELGGDCWVLSGAGWCVGGAAELPDRCRRELTRAYLGSGRLPRTVWLSTADRAAEPAAFALWPGGTGTEPPAARWFVVVRGDQDEWTAEQEAVAAELGTVVALVRARVDEARRIAGRSAETTLRRLLDGRAGPPEVAAGLETAGLSTAHPVRVAVLSAGDGGAVATALLREIAAATGMNSVTAPLREGATALFFDDAPSLAGLDEQLRDVLLAGGTPGVALGLSDVGSATGLRGAWEEADHARRLAERRSGRARFATAAELASHQVLLASVPDGLRRSYTDRLLSDLVEYDREHHSDLLRTLRVFLEHSGSWSRCAQQLHLHVNTLRYRIRRIEQITGRDLTRFPERVDFYLALALARETTGGED